MSTSPRLITLHDLTRPVTRGDCANGPRPCPWTDCRYHLLDSVSRGYHGTYPDVSTMPESCVLDVADRGEQTLEQVAQILLMTRERVRQLETKAIRAARRATARGAHSRELYEAIGGEKHRPELNDPRESVASLAGMSGGNFQGKVAAWQPENRKRLSHWVRQKKTPETTTEQRKQPQETIMAKSGKSEKPPKPPGVPRPDEATLAACLAHLNHLQSAGWTTREIAQRLGVTPQHMGNIISKKKGLSLALCEAVLALPQEPPVDAATEPAPKKPETKAEKIKAQRATGKPTTRKAPAATPAPKPASRDELLARLDRKIEVATEALRNAEYRLQVLREIRTEIGGEQ